MSRSDSESMVFLKKSDFKLPVGLEKALSPEGHSGQRRLQAVVGSIEMVMGRPHCTGLLVHLVM